MMSKRILDWFHVYFPRSAIKIFVANQFNIIHDNTEAHRWLYLPQKLNLVDTASQGIMSNEKDKKVAFWDGLDFVSSETYPNFEKTIGPASEQETTDIKSLDMPNGSNEDEKETFLPHKWALLKLRQE